MRRIDELPELELPLGDDDVHVHYCFTDRVQDPQLLARYDALMTADERARHRRFFFARDRHTFLLARALVRTALSRYTGTAAEDWRFDVNHWGRPHVIGPVDAPWFNLSHTRGLVACVMARTERVGVDVENVSRRTESRAIAHRFFSAAEVADLMALAESEHRQRFFALWTLKEAYIKARGMGLAIPLGKFSFVLEGEDISIRFARDLRDDPATWRFALLRASGEHLLAIGVARPNARLSATHVIPLST